MNKKLNINNVIYAIYENTLVGEPIVRPMVMPSGGKYIEFHSIMLCQIKPKIKVLKVAPDDLLGSLSKHFTRALKFLNAHSIALYA